MKRAGRYVLRIGAAVVMFLALAGPAPGNIGGCGSTVSVANPRDFCVERDYWRCVRDHYAGRINDAQRDECIGRVEDGCSAFTWPTGCAPTQSAAQACVQLLQRSDLASMTYEQLLDNYSECKLCM